MTTNPAPDDYLEHSHRPSKEHTAHLEKCQARCDTIAVPRWVVKVIVRSFVALLLGFMVTTLIVIIWLTKLNAQQNALSKKQEESQMAIIQRLDRRAADIKRTVEKVDNER